MSEKYGNWYVDYGDTLGDLEMESNAKIVIDYLREQKFSELAIATVLSWSDFLSTINPQYYENYPAPPSVIEPWGLLLFDSNNMRVWAGNNEPIKNGDLQLQYFIETANSIWGSNENATPSTPPWSFREWANTKGTTENMGLVMVVTFGWYYMHRDMEDLFDRNQLLINLEFWNVFLEEYGGGSKKKKKKKWIYYLKPKWR